MKLNAWIVGNLCVQEPVALGKINHMSVFVNYGIGSFEPGELFKF